MTYVDAVELISQLDDRPGRIGQRAPVAPM